MNEKSFEQLLEELNQVVSELESGKLSLEESVEKYTQGMNLSVECQKRLEQAKAVVVAKMTPSGEKSF